MRKSLGIMVVAAAAAMAGCLQKDTTHTLYLSPDGRICWMAIEASVRSDDSDPGRRFTEEQEYITAAATNAHGVGRGLAALDPARLRTRIVRDERPFVVITEAEFNSVELAVRRLFEELQLTGEVTLTRTGDVTTLVVRVDAAAAVENDTPPNDTPIDALAEDLERYRFVMTAGRFIAAKGFSLKEGGTLAVPVETPWEKIVENGGILEMSLTWTR